MQERATIAKLTSKGQITVPKQVRHSLRVAAGDRLLFKAQGAGYLVVKEQKPDMFAKYAGIGNKGIGTGKEAVAKWMREIRGYDNADQS